MVYSGVMFNQEGKTKMNTITEDALETAKVAARVLNSSTSDWSTAEDKALRPMARPLAEYEDLRGLAQAKLEAAQALLTALEELDPQ